MRERLRVLRAVLRSPVLRRLEAAFLAFSIGEWATWVAVVIYAYGRGGATEAGVVAFVQLVPSIVIAPIAGNLGDRFPRARVLTATYVVQGVAMAATSIALAVAASPLIVYGLCTLVATSVTLTRPTQASLLPEVVETPDELTAANVASASVEGAGMFVGPIVAGVLVTVGGPALVFAATAVGLLLGALAIGWTVAERTPAPPVPQIVAAADDVEPDRGGVFAGLGAIRADARLAIVLAVLGCSMFLVGSLDIFYAVLAIDVLGLGQGGVGAMGAAGGLGGIAGAAAALSLVGRRGLGRPLLLAAVASGLAIAVVGSIPFVLPAIVLLVVAGIGAQIVYVSTQTLIQRLAPAGVRSRVFGVVEGLSMAAQALGALAVPVLVALLGPGGAFVAAGAVLPVVAIVGASALISADRGSVIRTREIGLLRGIPMFELLAPPVLESLATSLEHVVVPAGATIIRQGDRGDRYYVIASGSVAIDVDGRHVHDHGAGEGFGEIALLRDVSRTATVRALGEVELLALRREPFLAALIGHAGSRAAADRVVREHLGPAG